MTRQPLLRQVRTAVPDSGAIDIEVPPTHTDEELVAAQHIPSEFPDVAVLVLSQNIEPTYAIRLIESHVERVGYVLNERVHAALVLADAISRVREGESVVDPTIVANVLGRKRRNDPLGALSEREHEVFALVAEGLSNRAIAARLYVAERTVESHVTQIFSKLGLADEDQSNRRVLAVLAFLRS
jgi:DNA-binding NarL/FixJ family response regulator